MAMTKRHFEKLARILSAERMKECKTPADVGYDNAVVMLTMKIADMCQEENPAFDRSRFYNAAGM